MSLAIMVLLLLPLSEATHQVLRFYDNFICVIFLIDFAGNLIASEPKREYFMHRRRLAGPARIDPEPRRPAVHRPVPPRPPEPPRPHLPPDGWPAPKGAGRDVVDNRSQYALFITILLAFMVLTVSSVLVLQFESRSPDANITTGGDALWWAIVTITTVGYGDFFPVTFLGRMTGVFVMFAGVGIIGSLASILASILVPDAPRGAGGRRRRGRSRPGRRRRLARRPRRVRVAAELAAMRTELTAMRELLAQESG